MNAKLKFIIFHLDKKVSSLFLALIIKQVFYVALILISKSGGNDEQSSHFVCDKYL